MEYGTKLCNTGKSPIQRRIAREIATWFSMPTIIAAYHFEDELTAYFEITMGFNSSHGEMSPNPGFRMMELQLFFHEFVQPWWNCALQNPESLFPNTFKYIEDNVRPVELKIMKKNQVLEGIQAGYDEMLKMHERSLTCPIIYLILVDSSRAPPLLRVILQLIEDHDTQLQFNHEDGWVDLSSYRRNIISNDSPESIWFGLLDSEEQKVKLCHFFRQFGFHRECIQLDLQKMSKAQPTKIRHVKVDKPIEKFKKEYPILHEALHCVFGMMMSNSRFMEQLHGCLRNDLPLQESYQMTDQKRRYMANLEYTYRKLRRALVEKKPATKPTDTNRTDKKKSHLASHHNTAAKHNRTKLQVGLIVHQLLERTKVYQDHNLMAKLPDEIKKKISIKTIENDGRLVENKRYEKDVKLRDETRKGRLTRTPVTFDEIFRDAQGTNVKNDMTWKRKRSEANLDRESDLDKFTKFSFWNGIQVDPLKGNIPLVLPSFNYDINTWTTKTTFLVVLKEYLDRLNSMAIDESIKTHDSVEVSRIEGKYERLSLFVKLDGSTLLSGPRDKKRAKTSKTKSVFEFSGTDYHCVGKKEGMCDTNEDIDLTEEID